MPIDILSNVAPKGMAPHSWQSQTPHESWGYKPPVAMSDELYRILNLPRRAQELDGTKRAEEIIDLMTERFARPNHRCRCADLNEEAGCITRLRLVQALALREIGICGGLLGPIGVGHGKTLIDLLAPLALQKVGITNTVLLVPPGLAKQLVGDYEHLGQHFKMPQIIFHGTEKFANTLAHRMSSSVPLERDAPYVHVVPYSRLRLPEATVWLSAQLKPQAIIADECHKLRNVKTATGARVDRYMESFPDTRFIGLSGSMTGKSIKDYWRLAAWALRGGSPLPREEQVVEDWARAIDPCQNNPADPGPLLKLCHPGERIESGFRRRLQETLGVVSTTAPAIDASLEIHERTPVFEIPPSVHDALNSIRNYVRPDGEELMDALSMAKCAREAACGFYYRWIFPHNVFPRDMQLVEEWREARKEWHKEVREKLKEGGDHMDSPLLCQRAAERAWGDRPATPGLPVWKAMHWRRWRDVRHQVKPETEPVIIDDYLARDAALWAEQHRGIIWYDHGAFGAWVAKLTGLPMYGGGPDGGGLIDPNGRITEDGSRTIILSVKAHGTGRNGLQNLYNEQLVANPMASADGWEQLLGRLHRIGQKAPVVRSWFYRHTEELQRHVDQALAAAFYIEGTLGSVQKLRVGFNLPKKSDYEE